MNGTYFFGRSASKVASNALKSTSTHCVAIGESGTICQVTGGALGWHAAAITGEVMVVQMDGAMACLISPKGRARRGRRI